MKSGRKQYILAAVVLAAFMIGSAGAADIGNTVKKACTACHSSKRICLNLGVKDGPAWKSTVQRMVSNGARLDGGQVDAAVQYLTGLAPGTGTVCE